MIDHNDIRRLRERQVFLPHDLEPEQEPPQCAQRKGEDVYRQLPEEVDRCRDVGEA
jgi:hypothetical protein